MAEQRLTTLSDFIGALRRRLWLLIVAVVVATGSAYLFSSRQTPAYEATSQVTFGAKPITAFTSPNTKLSSQVIQQNLATAAQTAHTTPVARLVLASAKVNGLTPDQLLKESSVTPSATSSFLTISVTDRFPARAQLLATSYAREYVKYSNAAAIQGLPQQIASLQHSIHKLKAKITAEAATCGAACASGDNTTLKGFDTQLGELQAAFNGLRNGNQVAETAQSASKVRPATTRNLAMGFGLGLVIGLVLISLAESLDTRVRSADDVAGRLGLPLLTRIPIPPRTLRKAGTLGMLGDEGGPETEAYRKLRINLDFANLSTKARTIMVTSAVEQEGKSTTVGNLAVALARAGRRVVLIDLDLRKPYLDHFFDLTGRPGLTDVALRSVTLDQALWAIPVPGSTGGPNAGSLHVLPSGPIPPNPADLIESSVVSEILLDLAQRSDVVLIDSAPLLPVSDGVVLSNKVDAMLVVVRATTINRQVLGEFQRVLAACPAAKLGFVLAGSEEGQGYGYGYGYGEYVSPAPAPQGASGGTPGTPDPTGSEADGSAALRQSPTKLR